MLAASLSRQVFAGPWSIQPQLGLTTDYESNPQLREFDIQGETHVAAVVDLPLRYDSDELEFLLRPNGRLSNSQGYSSLASNYAHVDTAAQFTDELDSATVQAEAAQDSSLYYLGGLVHGVGVRRDAVSTNADWTHSMTERLQFQLDASWTKAMYDEPADFNQLTNYRYVSAGPTIAYALSERNTIKLLGSYGLYQSLNGETESSTRNLQLGFVRQLTEIWTLSTSAGYSRSVNTENTYLDYFGYLIPVSEKSAQDGTVYAATLTRQGERFNLTAGVSQALQPTGFAFLSRQDSFNAGATYRRSERWDFALTASLLKARNPQETNGQAQFTEETDFRYLNAQFAANWHWTPEWTMTITATRITQEYGPPTVTGASSGFNISFVRQFLRTQL